MLQIHLSHGWHMLLRLKDIQAAGSGRLPVMGTLLMVLRKQSKLECCACPLDLVCPRLKGFWLTEFVLSSATAPAIQQDVPRMQP